MSIETLQSGEFDDNHEYETEKQFIAIDPVFFEHFKDSHELEAIEQIYLSHPDEPYSLRLRESTSTDGTTYSAALKDRGRVVPSGLRRMQIETPISAETYHYYKNAGIYPLLRKLRAHPAPGVSIDWCEGSGAPIIELEDLSAHPRARIFYAECQPLMTDQTGKKETSSEALAHELSPHHTLTMPEEISAQEILARIMAHRRQGTSPIVVCISGRSGSGKSTIASDLRYQALPHFGEITRLSTDDYHRGKTWLQTTYSAPWENWDAPEVYNTRLLTFDLWQLAQGNSIEARRFDFGLEEPVISGVVTPSELIIVEGIYADSPDLADSRTLHVSIPTPLATSVGRRLARDRQEARLNNSLSNSRDILRYQLEFAEPMHQQRLSIQAASPGQNLL